MLAIIIQLTYHNIPNTYGSQTVLGGRHPQRREKCRLTKVPFKIRGTQRDYSSKPLKHSIVNRILVFKQ